VSFEGLEKLCKEVLGDLTFADLELPYAAVTADMTTGEQVVLTEGRVASAVRASCSIPGVAAPVEIGGRLLVDGGVVNNLPISAVRSLGADIVIAVSLCSIPEQYPQSVVGMLAAAFDLLLLKAGDAPSNADIAISIPCSGFGTLLRIHRRHELLSLGRQAARQAVPTLRATLA
jgi:NTE family protein